MDQDTGGAILSRITGIHESIIQVMSMVGTINIDIAKTLVNNTISISDELKKHTGIFYEMQQMQTKSFNLSKDMKESLSVLDDIKSDLVSINKKYKGVSTKMKLLYM